MFNIKNKISKPCGEGFSETGSREKNYALDLTRGNVSSLLLRFSIPFMLSSLIQALYNTADLFIVSQYCSSESIAGVNIATQIYNVVINIVGGFCVGGTVMIAQYKGAGKTRDVRQTIGTLITIVAFITAGCMVATLVFSSPLLRLVNTPANVFNHARIYFVLCIVGLPFWAGFNLISGVLRGLGDPRRPLYFIIVSCIVNILFDLWFVGGLGWGVGGAALATLLAQMLSVILSVFYLQRSNFDFNFTMKKSYKIRADKLRSVLVQGAPTALQGAIVSISFLIMAAIVNSLPNPDKASAAIAIFSPYNSLALLPAIAIGQAVSAMAGQNIGAAKLKRASRTLWVGVGIAAAVCFAAFLVFMIFPEMLMRAFSGEPEVISYGIEYFRVGALDLLVVPLVFCLSNFIAGSGHPTVTMFSGIATSIVLRAPLGYLLGITAGMGIGGVALAVPISTMASNGILLAYYLTGRWKKSTITNNDYE